MYSHFVQNSSFLAMWRAIPWKSARTTAVCGLVGIVVGAPLSVLAFWPLMGLDAAWGTTLGLVQMAVGLALVLVALCVTVLLLAAVVDCLTWALRALSSRRTT